MSVKIELTGEGLSFSSETSLIKAAQIIAFINSETQLDRYSRNNQSGTELLIPSTSTKFSPREALNEANPKTNPQKILVFANYILVSEEKNSFDMDSVKQLFRKAGEPLPQNFNRDWKKAIQLSYIYETEENNTYQLTNYGENLLQTGFEAESNPASIKSSRTRSSSAKKSSQKTISENVLAIESFEPISEGLPNYHDISIKGNRILWILAFADKQGITELVPADIEYIAEKLRDSIPTSSITALTNSSYKKGFLAKTTDGKYKILHTGLEYIKSYQNNIDKL